MTDRSEAIGHATLTGIGRRAGYTYCMGRAIRVGEAGIYMTMIDNAVSASLEAMTLCIERMVCEAVARNR